MADVEIAPVRATRPAAGTLAAESLSAVLNAPTDDWTIPNNGSTVVQVVNEHATQDATVTVVTPQTVDGLAVADRVYTLPADRRSLVIGPWPVETYGRELRIQATAQGTLRCLALAF